MKKYIFLSISLSLFFVYCQTPQEESLEQITEMPDPALTLAKENYTKLCSSCHGEQMQAFVDRKWKYGKTQEALYTSIDSGYVDEGMPAWGAALSEAEISGLVDYVMGGIEEVEKYGFQEEKVVSDTFHSESLTFTIDTIARGLEVTWAFEFLPNGDLLVSERNGILYRVNDKGEKTIIQGLPPIRVKGQGGMQDIICHPDFKNNQLLYLSYAALKIEDGDSLMTTMVSRFRLEGNQLQDKKQILEALPYTNRPYHFGSMMKFDRNGDLFVTVGDRGERDVNPQNLSRPGGKVHRFKADGSIPADNPFVKVDTAVASIYSYGHRNPQGIALHPETGKIWTHEHGPRGGDEINIIEPGINYGWPVISYGINYNGTTFTKMLEKEGMKQPLHYWVPSIAPSGMAFVDSDKYGDWKGQLLVGSLRFKYLNLCRMENDKVVKEEILMKNIGRVRYVKVGPDGYIYIAVANPGFVFRLRPLK